MSMKKLLWLLLLPSLASADGYYAFDGANDRMVGEFTSSYADPLTIAFWARIADHPVSAQVIVIVGNSSSSAADSYACRLTGTDNTWVSASTNSTGNASVASATKAADDTWVPVICQFIADDSREVFVDDQDGANTGSRAVADVIKYIRFGESLTGANDWAGDLAYVSIWNTQISNASETAFLSGTCPSTIESANLIGYWSLQASNATQSNAGTDAGGDLAVTGATFSSSDGPNICGPLFTAGPTVGTVTTTTIPLTATSDTTGTWEAVACPDGQAAPTVAQVLAGNCTGDVAAEATFAQAVVATVGDSDTLTGLDPGTTYDVHSAIDATPDSSAISTNSNVTTNSLPTFSAGPSAGGVTSTTVTVNFTSDQSGDVYGVACPDGQAAPSVAQVKAGDCTGDINAVDAFTQAVVAAVADTDTFTGLSNSTTYDTHFMIDSTVNGDSAAIASLANQTTSAGGAPGFTSGPSVAAATNGFTISGTITCTGTCTVEAVACNPGDAAPSNAELEAGQCGGGNAALMNASEAWATGVGDSFTLTSANKPARFNVYVAGTDGTNDTTVIEFLNQNRSADSGQTIAVLSSVATTSIFDLDSYFDPDVAAGDVVEHDSDTNENAGCSVAFEADGDFTLTPDAAGDCDGKRTFDISYQDVSSATTGLFTAPTAGNFTTDDLVCNGNTAPEAGDAFDAPIAWTVGEAISALDLSTYFTDVDGDSLTFTLTTGTWPTGVSQSGTGNKDVTGTPTVENEAGVTLVVTATDTCGDTATFSFYDGVDIYPIDTWTVPNLDDMTTSEAEAAVVAAAPWRIGNPSVLITGYDCGTGQSFLNVATQSPAASGQAGANDPIEVEIVGAILPNLVGMTEAEAVAAIEAVCP